MSFESKVFQLKDSIVFFCIRIIGSLLFISDHNAWGMSSRISWIADTNSSIRIPKAPVMLDIETAKAQGAKAAAIGFALNGVSMYKVSHFI